MLDDVLGWLRCPQCVRDGALTRTDGSLRCGAGHSFDLARSGYVSLLPAGASRNAGDSAAMVAARRDFLAAGHFAGLAAAIADVACEAVASPGRTSPGRTSPANADPASGRGQSGHRPDRGCVVEVGAGTGYYLAAILDRLPESFGLALDLSKNALRVAARAHPRIAAIGCDAWRPLPVADGAADLVLSVFAPREGAELRRMLSPDGRLLVATPSADHLTELIGPLGLLDVDPRKHVRLTRKLSPYFELAATREHRERLLLNPASATALAAMGPASWHTESGALAEDVARLGDRIEVTLAVTLTSWLPA